MIIRMIREEWRMHSALYRGRSFATFPFVVLFFSLGFSWIVAEYSTLGLSEFGNGLQALGAFTGIAVGSIGFSSRDAVRNLLGPVNLLVYSSRTLPVSRRRLLFDFILKDIIYYTFIFLLPVALGPVLVSGMGVLSSSLMMFVWFLAGLAGSVLFARTSLMIPSPGVDYSRLSGLGPLSARSIIDVKRSSGGLIKIMFSLGILTGFYWFAVLYFPLTQRFLENPLLSFSVILGSLNLSIYNWLNRYDSEESYLYLPVDYRKLLGSKLKAYMALGLPFTVGVILLSYYFSPRNLFISLVSGVTTLLYTGLVASSLTGLEPNKKLFSSVVFLKLLFAYMVVLIPLLIFSLAYNANYFIYYLFLCMLISGISIFGIRKRI